MPTPGRQYVILQAIDPLDGTSTCEVRISHDRMQNVARRGMGHAKECGYTVPRILQYPTAIFRTDAGRAAGNRQAVL
jgi:hypothetical protein